MSLPPLRNGMKKWLTSPVLLKKAEVEKTEA